MRKHIKKIRIAAVMLMFFAVLFSFAGSYTAYAEERAELHSFQDFFEQFSLQIHDRKTLCYYDVPDKTLAKDLVYQDLSEYGKHYDPEKPLLSGCYLVYYVQTVYFTYDANGLKVLIEFPYNGGDMDAHFQEMDRLALQLKRDTDYETVKSVHDYLIDNFEYDHSTDMVNHTDIDGFRDKVMVCTGYSLATYYLLNTLGIDTRIITGYSGEGGDQSENHMWNMVKLDDKWYNLDVTWDDGGGKNKLYNYFLKSDADFPQHVRLGVYATAEIAEQVAKESYPIPFWTRMRIKFQDNWYVIVILAGVIIYVSVTYVKRLRHGRLQSYQNDTEPVEYIPDWTERMGTNIYNPDNMKYTNPYGSGYGSGNVNPYSPGSMNGNTDPFERTMYQPFSEALNNRKPPAPFSDQKAEDTDNNTGE